MKSRLHLAACLAAAASLGACTSTPLERSCDGERVDDCDPHAYAVVRDVTLDPPMVMPGDPTARIQVRVELGKCEDAPGNHRVVMEARTSRAGFGDAGDSLMVIMLEELRDDGTTFGDETAGDGVIDVSVPNPFFELPPERTVDLRFEPRLGSCEGEALELQYTTGPEWSADGGGL